MGELACLLFILNTKQILVLPNFIFSYMSFVPLKMFLKNA